MHAREPDAATGRRWSVVRLDDNGNVAVVRAALSKDDAEALASEMEARGHKQMYWIEPEGGRKG